MIDEKWCYPILRKLIKPDDEVCVLAFSFFNDTKNSNDWDKQYAKGQGILYRSNTDVFVKYGLKENQIHWVNYFKDSKEDVLKKVLGSSILLLTGGAPDLMTVSYTHLDVYKRQVYAMINRDIDSTETNVNTRF